MSRTTRLQAILEIVRRESVANQAELVSLLEQRGIQASQGTVSRDVRHLGLVKVRAREGGGSRYIPAEEVQELAPTLEGLRSLFQHSVTQVHAGSALLVIRTPAGFANAVALAVDGCRLKEIVGTVAGDDTLLVVLRSERDRDRVLGELEALMS